MVMIQGQDNHSHQPVEPLKSNPGLKPATFLASRANDGTFFQERVVRLPSTNDVWPKI